MLNNLGNLYKDIGDYQKAESYYSRALDVNPDYVMAYSNIFYAKHYNPKATQEEIIAFAKRWDDRFALPVMPPVAGKLVKGKALRVGLISSGFRTHPVGQMITTALENSQTGIQFYGYTTNDQVDQVTERLRAACSEWRPIRHLSQTKLAQLIRDDQIDILIDLSGHGDGSCLQAISMRPAPINVKWVGGLVNTMAVESIDYLLSDSIETPEGVDDQYTEKLIRLPDDYICYTPCPYAPPTTSLPALKNGYITLGCLNNPAKISAELLAEWAKLMHEFPQSRILLRGAQYESESFCQKIRGIFASLGIEASRVILEGPTKHEEFIKTYQRIDIALDTWPYSGGLTTCEALLMGVPVVTLPGPTFAGRHSATHLTNAGLQELVVNNWDEYRQRVKELASDLPNLAVIRAGLRTILHYSPVCDAPRFANHFSNALRAIWVRYCEGKPPEALTFNKEGELWFEDDKQPLELPEAGSEEATESKAFEWQLEEPITIIDNAAVLPRHPDYPKWMASGHLTVISFDPASLLTKRVEELKEYGELHHYPHALLGDGQPATLYATLDAEQSSTLKPLPEEQQPEYMRGKLKVLAELPINTVALDQIEGLPSVDMLVLDDLHDAMAILENGKETLRNTLMIQVKLAFQRAHAGQSNLSGLEAWSRQHGFRIHTLANSLYRNGLSGNASSLQSSELVACDAIIIPVEERVAEFSRDRLKKFAFVLHSIYGFYDKAYHVLTKIGSDEAEEYLASFVAPGVEEKAREKEKKKLGTRRFTLPGIGAEELFERLNAAGVRYAILRWFETLPQVEEGEDIDILVEDDDLEKLSPFFQAAPGEGSLKCDIYSVTGRVDSHFEGLPYYEAKLAREILDNTVLFKGKYRVPDTKRHLLSLAYHAVFHKADFSGLPKRHGELPLTTRAVDHDYADFIGRLAKEVGVKVDCSLEGLFAFLQGEGWVPTIDLVRKLSLRRPWLRSLYPPASLLDTAHGEAACFVVREWAAENCDIGEVVKTIESSGFDVKEVVLLDNEERKKIFALSARGGNWNQGPWPVSGGRPYAVILAYDYYPKPPVESVRRKHPFLSNQRVIEVKQKIRDYFNSNVAASMRANAIHSADDEPEAIEYASLLGADVKQRFMESFGKGYCGKGEVRELIHRGRRAATYLVYQDGSPFIEKVFEDSDEGRASFENEAFANEKFSNFSWFPEGYVVADLVIRQKAYPEAARLDRLSSLLGPSEKRKIAGMVLEVISDIYEAGYAHRDIHAKNIFYSNGGLVLIDFETLCSQSNKVDLFESYDITAQGLPSPHLTGHMCFNHERLPYSLKNILGVGLSEAKKYMKKEAVKS